MNKLRVEIGFSIIVDSNKYGFFRINRVLVSWKRGCGNSLDGKSKLDANFNINRYILDNKSIRGSGVSGARCDNSVDKANNFGLEIRKWGSKVDRENDVDLA